MPSSGGDIQAKEYWDFWSALVDSGQFNENINIFGHHNSCQNIDLSFQDMKKHYKVQYDKVIHLITLSQTNILKMSNNDSFGSISILLLESDLLKFDFSKT